MTSAKADAFFAQRRFVQAAELYAQSSRSFEEVVLKFIDREERDALRNYLHSRLGRLRKSVRMSKFTVWNTAERSAGSDATHDAGDLAR